jgi:glycosyltransferase involved in cell wall biosynthesis
LYDGFKDMPVVSISDSQREPLLHASWLGTVYHGLPESLFRFTPTSSDYYAFVGRISRDKRVDRAVEIAESLGVPLRIAAKIDKNDRAYYEEQVAKLFEHPLVEYIGEVSDEAKAELLGSARALLFPIDWPEPFGLVMIEAMACGTPVVAFGHGSVPEVLEDGVSGYIVHDVPSAVEAARRAQHLDRERVRRAFERRFTARRMALDYVKLYQQVAERGAARRPGGRAA